MLISALDIAAEKPPKIVTAMLYDKAMPDERNAVGKSSESAAEAGAVYNTISTA